MSTFTCTYCGEVKNGHSEKDHFVSSQILSGTKRYMVICCRPCNRIKRNHLFWSIEAVREYVKYRKKEGNGTHRKWMYDKIKRHVLTVEDLMILSLLFDKKLHRYSYYNGKELQ